MKVLDFLPSLVEMFLHNTAPAWSESVAVARGSRSRASAHAPLASGSVFQGTRTFRTGSRPKLGLFFEQTFGPGAVTRLETVL